MYACVKCSAYCCQSGYGRHYGLSFETYCNFEWKILRTATKDLAAANGYIEEMMQGQKVVKVFCHEEKSIEEFKELNDKLFHSADNANKFANIAMPVNAQVGNISYVIVAIVGGILAINGIGRFTLGGLASFLTFNKSLSQPIGQISQQINCVVEWHWPVHIVSLSCLTKSRK